MTTIIPTNIRRPGNFTDFLYTSGRRSLVPSDRPIALLGIKSSAGTLAAATPTRILDTTEADTLAGKGSELALMARAALAQGEREPSPPPLYLVAIAAPSGGGTAAAVSTLTFSGTATASGNAIVRIAGRPVIVPVTSGDTAATVAAAAEAAIDALVDVLPVTASVVGAVVTCTAVHAGANGNDVKFRAEQLVAGISLAIAQTVAGAGTTDLTASLAVLEGARYDAIVTANGDANDVSDLAAHLAVTNTAGAGRWRRVYLAETGTIGAATTHASSFNTVGALVVTAEQFESLPGELAAAKAVAECGASRPNPNLNGHVLVGYASPASYWYTETEIETALAAGLTPLAPVLNSAGAAIDGVVRIVKPSTTKTTEGGAPVEFPRAPYVSNVGWYLARQIDAKFAEQFTGPEALIDSQAPARIKDMIVDVLYAAQTARIVRQVDDVIGLIVVEVDGSVTGRLNADVPYVPVGPIDQLATLHRVTMNLGRGL